MGEGEGAVCEGGGRWWFGEGAGERLGEGLGRGELTDSRDRCAGKNNLIIQ